LAAEFVFDKPFAIASVEARKAGVRSLLTSLRQKLELHTAVDIGCGVGYFSAFLHEMGFEVVGVDGRKDNVREAQARHPQVPFEHGNLEDPAILSRGPFDLVFCFGLIYHLENPLLAIRHLRLLTSKALLIESMCAPGDQPWMFLREEPHLEDQSLTYLAFYPTESCLVKMLYRCGFSTVHRPSILPDHDDFRETSDHFRRRTVLLASPALVNFPGTFPQFVTHEPSDPWCKEPPATIRFARRLRKFRDMTARGKYLAATRQIQRWLPQTPIPVRLSFGAWWMARSDYMSSALIHDGFEVAECAFVGRFLRSGMTVLDVGAHHGIYTLLASKLVGSSGRVVAFEPSPRERKALRRNVGMNRCKNVAIEGLALGTMEHESSLYVVDHHESGCNSLRPPATLGSVSTVSVRVTSLDRWLTERHLETVNFIKLDVEGGELAVLKGAEGVLRCRPRPIILAEVQDIRTQPWGYAAREIIKYLSDRGYKWFSISEDGSLESLDVLADAFDGNFVACPEEAVPTLDQLKLLTSGDAKCIELSSEGR